MKVVFFLIKQCKIFRTMEKIKTKYNDKKMVHKNPYRRRGASAKDVIGGDENQSDHLPTTRTAKYCFCRWGEKIFQAQPERIARPVFDAGYAQSG